MAPTDAIKAAETTPYLSIRSAEKRSGKTRELDVLETLVPEPLKAENISVAALAHLVDAGAPVEVGGIRVSSGDLMHADKHGVTAIPHEIAREVAAACQRVEDGERRVINYCKSADFDVERLKTRDF